MKFVIDEEVAVKNNLSIQELLLTLLVKVGADIPAVLEQLQKREVVVKDIFNNYYITPHWIDVCDNILLSSEKAIPRDDNLAPLAEELMAMMPQGKMSGTAYYYKCNKREIILKLKKFTKLYGQYSFEDIKKATKRYVESFNGNYTYMKLLKYFILKEERKVDAEGNGFVEENSILATMLENPDSINVSNNDIGELI